MTTAAQLIARRLHQAGCRHAFGIPGGEVLSLMQALDEAGINFRLVKHENNGGFMAEGTHHVNGAPGILLATIGPGVVNAINVVANAYQDQVPLIFLTGCVDAAEAQTFTHQVMDHGKVLDSITKATFRVDAGAVDATVSKAIAIAIADPPGPVHLDIPISVAGASVADNEFRTPATPSPMAPAPGPALDAARVALAGAKRPLVIAGVDVLHHGAAATLAETVRRLDLPLLTTYKAKGVLPEDDPLALGGRGLSPKSFKIIKPLIDAADVILLAGYDPIEMRVDWRDPWRLGTTDSPTVIDISSKANTHFMHQASLTFIGDIGAGLDAVCGGLAAADHWPGGEPAAVRAALGQAFPGDEDWGPAAVIDTARKALPRNGVATVDTGAHRILLAEQWDCFAPRTLLQSCGLCTMGAALPLAMGYKLASPETPVIAFTGDAGMEMVLGELATLRDMRLSLPIIVFVDEQLALIEIKQRREGLGNLGVDFDGTDFAAVAEAIGGVGVTAGDRASLTAALEAALGRQTFTVIACPIGRAAYDGRF